MYLHNPNKPLVLRILIKQILKMKILTALILLSISLSSCAQSPSFDNLIEDPNMILKDQSAFLNYYNTYIKLSENFIAYDIQENLITRETFLLKVSSGEYLPLRLNSKDTVKYKLYKLNLPADNYVPTILRAAGAIEYKHYQMEGKPIPKFDFVDIKGNHYTPETTVGKIVVLKFWFIHCTQCVAEMPSLNKLVNSYRDRKDILFVSLALDQKNDLLEFVKKRKFNYIIIPNQKEYLLNDLGITYFPTHVIIDKKGLVVKAITSYEEMEPILKKEALK